MYRYEDIELRKFKVEDIPYKVEWINSSKNNEYLHYKLPLTIESQTEWFDYVKDRTDRWDGTVVYKGKPVGNCGLLNIDYENKTAEDYSLIGDTSVKGIGLGTKAGILNICYAFYILGLNKVWGTIEVGNLASLKMWRKMGGIVEGYLHDYRCKGGKFVDGYYVAILKNSFTIPDNVFEDEA